MSDGFGNMHLKINSHQELSIIILSFLLFIGTILRFYQIGTTSLWLDEVMTYQFSINPFLEYWNLISAGGEVHPPLFYWIEWTALKFGNNEFVLRFFPAIFGILSIPLIYFLGLELFNRVEVGLLAAALLTFSPFHIIYSQEARMYSLVLLFMVLALIAYIRAIRTNEMKDWVLFAVFSALTLWTHFYPAIFIGILYLAALYRNTQYVKRIAASFVLFVLIFLPLIPIAVQLFSVRTEGLPSWGLSALAFLISTLIKFSFSSTIGLIVLFSIFIVGIIELKNKEMRDLALGLIFILIISSALAFRMPMVERYILFLLPVYYVGIAGVYSLFKEKENKKMIFPVIFLWIVLLSMPGLIGYYTEGEYYDWRGAAGYLSDNKTEFDSLLVMPGYNSVPLEYYYTPENIEIMKISTMEELNFSFPDSRDYIIYTNDVRATDSRLFNRLNENTTPIWKGSGVIIAKISQD